MGHQVERLAPADRAGISAFRGMPPFWLARLLGGGVRPPFTLKND
jgi:hypothetical protein